MDIIILFIILAIINPSFGMGFLASYIIFGSIALLLKPWLNK